MAQRTAKRPRSKRAERAVARRQAARRRQQLRLAAVVAVVVVVGLLLAFFAGGDDGADEPSGPTARPFVGGDLHSLVADPTTPDRAFVGGHEGVAVSTDGGRMWRQVPSLEGADAMGWAFAGDRVLVGGHPGLFVSQDGGRTFEQRNDGLPSTDIHALGSSPDGEVLYAASPGVGVFASGDGGQTWQVRTEGAGQSFMGRILVDPEDPDRVIAPDMQGGAVESTDGGRTWRSLGGVPGTMWVSWDAEDVAHLVVSGTGGALESRDGGETWDPLEVPAEVTVVEVVSGSTDTLLAGAHDGNNGAVISISTDGGRNWTAGQSAAG